MVVVNTVYRSFGKNLLITFLLIVKEASRLNDKTNIIRVTVGVSIVRDMAITIKYNYKVREIH